MCTIHRVWCRSCCMDGFVSCYVSIQSAYSCVRSRLISETYECFLCTEEEATFSSSLLDGVAVVVVFICRSCLSIGTFVRLNICQFDIKMGIFALEWVFFFDLSIIIFYLNQFADYELFHQLSGITRVANILKIFGTIFAGNIAYQFATARMLFVVVQWKQIVIIHLLIFVWQNLFGFQ